MPGNMFIIRTLRSKFLVTFFTCFATAAIAAPMQTALQTPANNPTSNQAPNPNAVLTGFGPITNTNVSKSATPAPEINAKGYVLMDASSGQILAEKNPDAHLQPASLTKLMTMYVISNALKANKIHLNDLVTISKDAWRTGGSRMFIQVGTQVPVLQLLEGIVIVSGNDAAVAMSEYVGGNQDTFVQMMNQDAGMLGMKDSHFADVNGLPIPNHYTSPRDLAILTRALITQFPDYYKAWYGQKWFEYNNIKQANRNHLLWLDPSVDGLKTGFTDAAGYCLVASAERNGMRLISVVMGAPSPKARLDASQALLNWGFRNYSSHQLYAAGQTLAKPRVWFGKEPYVPMGLERGIHVTIPNGQYPNLKATLTLNNELQAPVVKGKPYGVVQITLNNQPLLSEPVVALTDDPMGGPFTRLKDKAIKMFRGTPN